MVLPPELLAPLGIVIAAVGTAATLLVRLGVSLVREYIADLKVQRDRAIAGWEAQGAATARLADVLEAKQRDEASRHRTTDR